MENRKVLRLFEEKNLAVILVVILVVVSRVLPHVPNFTPITALALYGGTYIGKRFSVLIPVSSMFLSDLIIGFHGTMIYVYLSFLIISLLGIWLSESKNFKNIVLITFSSSLLFFLITNFGVWIEGKIYPHTFQGLADCYVLAVPFLRNTLFGDFFYVGLFFGAHELFVNIGLKNALRRVKNI